MPFPQTPPEELERILQHGLASVRQHPNPLQNPHGMNFLHIERTAHEIGQQVATRLTQQALADHAQDQPEQAPCPQCQQPCRLTRKKRTLTTPDGSFDYLEPAAHRVNAAAIFFPTRPELKLGERQYSPSFQHKLAETATRTKSFAQTAELAKL